MQGYSCIGLDNPKNEINVGSALRAAGVYGASMLAISGARYVRSRTDTMKAFRHIPVLRVDDLKTVIPFDCVPVAIEIIDGARPLPSYTHPERAFYVFGQEDGTLGNRVLSWCRDVVYIPTDGCMNLAATVNVVLYDRLSKNNKEDHTMIRVNWNYDAKRRAIVAFSKHHDNGEYIIRENNHGVRLSGSPELLPDGKPKMFPEVCNAMAWVENQEISTAKKKRGNCRMKGAIIVHKNELKREPISKWLRPLKEQFIALKIITGYRFDNTDWRLSWSSGREFVIALYKQKNVAQNSETSKHLQRKFNIGWADVTSVFTFYLYADCGLTQLGKWSFYEKDYVKNPIPSDVLDKVDTRCREYSKGQKPCSDCRDMINTDNKNRYFAGTYCNDCRLGNKGKYKGSGGWQEIERRETYE